MRKDTTPFIALALTGLLLVSGCIGNAEDALGTFSDDGDENIQVTLAATNASADLAHIGFALDGVFAHDANTAPPDGYHEIDLATEQADVLIGTDTHSVEAAAGSIPAGDYDQVLFRLESAQAHGADAMSGMGGHDHGSGSEEGHAHDDGGHGDGNASDSSDGHAHDHGGHAHDGASSSKGAKTGLSVTTSSIDLPVNVTFQVADGETTKIRLVLDVGASTTAESFSPVFANVTVERAGEIVSTREDVGIETSYTGDGGASEPATPRPAARMAVFAPNGDQVYKPGFDVEQNVFVNSKTSAYKPGETVRFTGTESDPVATGAEISEYRWDFDDGNTTTGPSVKHAWEQQGVFEVTLTVEDSNGVTGQHTVRVIVLQETWTTTLVETGFEESAEGWTNATGSAGDQGVPGAGVSAPSPVETSWALDGAGHNSSTAWHVGNHEWHGTPAEEAIAADGPGGYNDNAKATLISPAYEIPANWTKAGYSFYIGGFSEPGFDPLTITYSIDGNSTVVSQVDTADGWVHFEDLGALTNAAGKTIQFTFAFESDGNTNEGPGFYLDDFTLGGVDLPVRNAHLLEEGGDGHDHSH